LGVDLLPVRFGERVTEKTAVFLEDLRISTVSEALEERG
jgi:hypothetical protein